MIRSFLRRFVYSREVAELNFQISELKKELEFYKKENVSMRDTFRTIKGICQC